MATILAVDTSAKSVSCALVRDGRVLASFFSNTGLTHSQTLLPMVEDLLRVADVTVEGLDAMAVNAGPGSFTGVRIGVAAVKGLAFTSDRPCVAVSTLESMAMNVPLNPGVAVCGVMDARCQQVYTALFTVDESGTLIRLWDDEAISIADLGEQLKKVGKEIVLVGDGSELCYDTLKGVVNGLTLAPASVRLQNAVGTALVAERLYEQGVTVTAEELLPTYLRLPQAERELNARLGK